MNHRAPFATLALASLVTAGCQSDAPSDTGTSRSDVDAWPRSFNIDKSDLVSTGVNPYFDLTPNTTRVYRDDDVTLTITVLDETFVVDDVTTRIVEEREERGGEPEEISRNYFAIDRMSGAVYYFGEHVDVYQDGRVTHPGAWLSGVEGAQFGLMMPGRPRVGDRGYQEVAPGVAMDRFEVVATDETIVTPAGTFEHCLHVRETSPLERGASHKWYVEGLGLIRDDEAVLVSPRGEGA